MKFRSKCTKIVAISTVVGIFAMLTFPNDGLTNAYAAKIEKPQTKVEQGAVKKAEVSKDLAEIIVDKNKVEIQGEARPLKTQLSAQNCGEIAIKEFKALYKKDLKDCKIKMVYVDFFEFWSVHFIFSEKEEYEMIVGADDFKGANIKAFKLKK